MARSLPRLTAQNKLRLRNLLLLCCACLAVLPSGCEVLFPTPDHHVQPDRPDDDDADDNKPVPAPDRAKDPHKVRKGIATALGNDKVAKQDAILLYGVFAGTADFVDSLESGTEATTTSLGDNMAKMLTQVGWPKNKYKAVKAELSRAWQEYEFLEDAKPLSDEGTRDGVSAMFRLLAAGCRDVLEGK
jgi:hypothetical protein